MADDRISPEDQHQQDLNAMLAKVHRRSRGDGMELATPFDELAAQEDGVASDEGAIRSEVIRKWLGWIFAKGPDPAEAMKRLYTFAQSFAPDMILNLTCEEIATIFAQGRAAQSARVKLLITRPLEAAGCHNPHMRFQKSASAVEKYRAVQRGNTNRRKGARAAAA